MNPKVSLIISAAAVVIMCVVIFAFSAMPVDDSTALSTDVIWRIVGFIVPGYGLMTLTGQLYWSELLQFPAYQTTMRKYLADSELLAAIHDSLAVGVPAPIEWAAKYGDEWTLHYSLATGLDIPNDKVTVANPYGYVEELSLSDFLRRTSFEAYENMPLFLKLGFAFGIFEENTAFVPERRA